MTIIFPRFKNRALCAETDAELWFPEQGQRSAPAKRICNGYDDRPPCPAKAECLEWAMTHEEIGIWGGRSRLERYWLRRRRAA